MGACDSSVYYIFCFLSSFFICCVISVVANDKKEPCEEIGTCNFSQLSYETSSLVCQLWLNILSSDGSSSYLDVSVSQSITCSSFVFTLFSIYLYIGWDWWGQGIMMIDLFASDLFHDWNNTSYSFWMLSLHLSFTNSQSSLVGLDTWVWLSL